MRFFEAVVLDAVLTGIALVGVWLALLAVELSFPKSRVSWFGRLRALCYWSLCIPTWALLSTGFGWLWREIGVEPLISTRIDTGTAWLNLVLAVIIGNLIADFFFYWRHRAQHRWFWKYHAVHHSIRELSSLNSYHHISEELFRIVFAAIPAALLFDVQAAFWAGLTRTLLTSYAHAPVRLQLGPLRYFLIDPSIHRIHHSTDPAHFDKNFCSFTPLWDVLFGTAYFPKNGEWPDTGLADYPEPDGVADWLGAPWRGQPRGNAADGAVKLPV